MLWEIKKLMLRWQWVVVIVVTLLIVNAAMLFSVVDRQLSEYLVYGDGLENVYSQIEGTMTSDQISWIIEERDRLNGIIDSGDYSTEDNQFGTYTGWVYADCNLLNKIYDEVKYSFEYAVFARSVQESAQEILNRLSSIGNFADSKYYGQMMEAFRGRNVAAFYRTDGYVEYFEYAFSNLCILLLTTLVITTLFSEEREIRMDVILRLTSKGMVKARNHKLVTAFVFTVLIVMLFSIEDYVLFAYFYHFRGLMNPLYAIPEFQNTAFNLTISGSLLINLILKVVGTSTFTTFLLAASAVARSNLSALVIGGALLVICIVLNTVAPQISFVPLMNAMDQSKEFSYQVVWQTFVQMFLSIVAIITTCLLDSIKNRQK